MSALAAVIFFALALILDVLDQSGDLVSTFTLAGLLCIALHLTGFITAGPWTRRQ